MRGRATRVYGIVRGGGGGMRVYGIIRERAISVYCTMRGRGTRVYVTMRGGP